MELSEGQLLTLGAFYLATERKGSLEAHASVIDSVLEELVTERRIMRFWPGLVSRSVDAYLRYLSDKGLVIRKLPGGYYWELTDQGASMGQLIAASLRRGYGAQ